MDAAPPLTWCFLGAIFDPDVVRSLRFHSVRCTCTATPSAAPIRPWSRPGAGNPVLAHDNAYNRWTAGPRRSYFSTARGRRRRAGCDPGRSRDAAGDGQRPASATAQDLTWDQSASSTGAAEPFCREPATRRRSGRGLTSGESWPLSASARWAYRTCAMVRALHGRGGRRRRRCHRVPAERSEEVHGVGDLSSLDKPARRRDSDAAIVATPSRLHYPMVKQLL